MQYEISQQTKILTDKITINTSQIFFIKDSEEEMIQRIKEHVDNDDYFGTLATVFSLMIQSKHINKTNAQILDKTIKDLLYLQKKYKITEKEEY